jgi:hypothetical protein
VIIITPPWQTNRAQQRSLESLLLRSGGSMGMGGRSQQQQQQEEL